MQKKLWIGLLVFLLGLLPACTLSRITPTSPAGPSVHTLAALTVEALGTQLALTNTPNIGEPSPQQDWTPTPTIETNPTETPTGEPSPTNQPATPTTASLCDKATFVSETVFDNTIFFPNTTFTKSWTLRNNGTCTWNSGYQLVFDTGDRLEGSASKQLTTDNVPPGGSVKISIPLKSPEATGTYKGFWKLKNDKGEIFGIGANGDKPFWIQIKVVPYDGTLTTAYCSATWRSGIGELPCPGKAGDSSGSIRLIENPKMENGATDDEPALVTIPENINGGEIWGRYPAIKLGSGQHLKLTVGCMFDAPKCDVKFVVKVIVDGGSEITLWELDKKYNGSLAQADLDLSAYANKNVEILLGIKTNGSPKDDVAFWLLPKIVTP